VIWLNVVHNMYFFARYYLFFRAIKDWYIDYNTPFWGRIDDDVIWDSDIVVSNSARNEHVSQSETIRIYWWEKFGITANILYLRTLFFLDV